ncbi:MAG: alpha-glucosidase C-terminal domain-containing protein, partial [Anaerobacillus sp.]
RRYEGDTLLVILNFSDQKCEFALPEELEHRSKSLLISNYEVDEEESIEEFVLNAYEARVYKLII